MSISYIGIIGWGPATQQIAERLHHHTKGTEVLAVATLNKEGQKFSKSVLGLKHVFSDPMPLYELHQLNVIYIASNPENHLEHTTHCLKSGTDILIEFPLASNVSDCIEIEKAVRNHPSQKALLGFPRRFDPYLKELQKQVSEGKIGHILSISVNNYESLREGHAQNPFHESKGIFMDLTIQDIDMIRWISGQEFTSVYAQGGARKYPSLKRNNDIDTAIINGKLEEGTLVNLLSSRAGVTEDGFSINVTGTKGQLSYSTVQNNLSLTSTDLVVKDINIPYQAQEHLKMVDYFINQTMKGTRLPYNVSEGTEATKVAVAMTRSFLMNQIVNID